MKQKHALAGTKGIGTKHRIAGGGGLGLSVREWGNGNGAPILFIHGFSQSHLSWAAQYESSLADRFRLVVMDLRGHGESDKPLEAANYTDGARWADDVAAVIRALGLNRPVLVGWSYGGFVLCDYVKRHGQDAVAGLNFVGAAVQLTPAFEMLGPGFLENAEGTMSPDLATRIRSVRNFVRACTANAVAADDFATTVASNMVVPVEVKAGMVSRELNFDDVLAGLSIPVLVTHGRDDRMVLPAMSERIAAIVPRARISFYDGVGHAPFLEDAERFNRELAAFVELASHRGAKA
ncbi:MAG: alpha/beta hydrolase [Burkholderiales bacterium]